MSTKPALVKSVQLASAAPTVAAAVAVAAKVVEAVVMVVAAAAKAVFAALMVPALAMGAGGAAVVVAVTAVATAATERRSTHKTRAHRSGKAPSGAFFMPDARL